MSRLPPRQRSRQRPRWAARGRKRHARARPRAPNAPPMPSAPPFAGASARRQARQLQHLPFRARALHRSHAASILLFRFHHGNTLSFRSTLDCSHGDCSRSAARPTDRLIFLPAFFFLFSSASAHSIEWMRPVGSHRSCTRSHLTPVGVRLPTSREFARRPCSPRRLHGSAPFCVFEFSLGASVGPSVRSAAPVQTCAPRLSDSATGVVLWRKRNPSLRFHRPPPAVCSRFAPLPHVRRSNFFAAAVPLHTVSQRHVLCAHRQHTPIPGLRSPRAAEPLHPSFSLSFPCPNFSFRGCC